MRKRLALMAIGSALALGACASVGEVQRGDAGAYSVTSGSVLASVDPSAAALAKARAFCGRSGQVPVQSAAASGDVVLGMSNFSFTCQPL